MSTILRSAIRTTRQPHTCDTGKCRLPVGTDYFYGVVMVDGTFRTVGNCLSCAAQWMPVQLETATRLRYESNRDEARRMAKMLKEARAMESFWKESNP